MTVALHGATALVSASLLCAGCSGLLGLDDKTFEGSTGSGGTATTTTTASGGSGGSSTTSSGSGGAVIATLDDEFDFDPLGNPDKALRDRGWRFTREEEPYPANAPAPKVLVEDGTLRIVIDKTFYWFNANKGFLMYKEVSGDFLIVADVTSETYDPAGAVPQDMQSGTGILVRDPAGAAFAMGDQHSVAVDRGANTGALHIHGTAVGPGGAPVSMPANTSLEQGKVAICRKGNDFMIWSKELSDSWQNRTDLLAQAVVGIMPDPVQVGLFTYAAAANPQTVSPAGVLGTIAFVHQYLPGSSCNPDDYGE